MLLVIFGFIIFIGLVVVHEFGHFIAARKSGVEVEEFGVGFPPRAYGKKLKSGLLLSINWLPLGGFVRLKGEHDSAKAEGSFGAATLPKKIFIMLAGVFMNLVTAFVLLTILALIGMPQLIENQYTVPSDTTIARQDLLVGRVEQGSPAEKAGLQTRDKLLRYGQPGSSQLQNFATAQDLPTITKTFAGKDIQIEYERAGNVSTTTPALRTTDEVEKSKKTDNPVGYLGILPAEYTLTRSTWSAPIVAGGLIGQLTKENFIGLGKVVKNVFTGQGKQAGEQVTGPIGVAQLVFDSSKLGFQSLLLIMAIISLTLAIMNVLPIPALDGGRLFVTLLFHTLHKLSVIKNPLSKKTEELIHGTGFLALIGLAVLISILDVGKLL